MNRTQIWRLVTLKHYTQTNVINQINSDDDDDDSLQCLYIYVMSQQADQQLQVSCRVAYKRKILRPVYKNKH
jgi:hypothetical protein